SQSVALLSVSAAWLSARSEAAACTGGLNSGRPRKSGCVSDLRGRFMLRRQVSARNKKRYVPEADGAYCQWIFGNVRRARSSHALRRIDVADLADRPFG